MAFLVTGLVTGCASGSSKSSGSGKHGSSTYGNRYKSAQRASSIPRSQAPSWLYEPLSWRKLDDVETWLDTDSRYAPDGDRIEAELVLAEGRLTFARRDAARLTSAALSARLDGAREGFERVTRDPAASAQARHRADRGLDEVAALSGGRRATTASVTTSGSRPVGGGLIPRSTWRAAPVSRARLTPNHTAWNRITVHHSAEHSRTLGSGSAGEAAEMIRRIQRYHQRDQGYGDIGYHFLIDPRGRIFEGRSLEWQGAHAGGNDNVGNIGICVLGSYDQEAPSGAALAALKALIDELRRQTGIPARRVVAHKDLKVTVCPGDHLARWVGRYRS